jgi:hypothetical protein
MLWAQEVLEAQAPGVGAELAAIQHLILLRSAQPPVVQVPMERSKDQRLFNGRALADQPA